MGTDEDFQKLEKAKSVSRQAQELEDNNNAMAGRFDTGRRINRGFKAVHENEEIRKKNEKNALSQALKISAHYAKLYQNTMQNFHDTSNAVYDAQIVGGQRVSEAEAIIQKALDNASTMPDGTAVFRSQDGSVYTQDGEKLEDDALVGISWRENAPAWETYQEQRKDLDEKLQFLERMNGHEERLLDLQDELETLKDQDTPENAERMSEISEELDSIEADASLENKATNEFVTTPQSPIIVPNLNF